mmetsp:Transcript_34837/g.73480  ORF Transcript_34837/g.73480 Transcript_34837/m.73480 type:complete len:81 (+) Transcript_34837:244-486(+)
MILDDDAVAFSPIFRGHCNGWMRRCKYHDATFDMPQFESNCASSEAGGGSYHRHVVASLFNSHHNMTFLVRRLHDTSTRG